MKHQILTTTFCISLSGFLFAQDANTLPVKSEIRTVELLGTTDMTVDGPQFEPWITTTAIYHDPKEVPVLPGGAKIRYPEMAADGSAARDERASEAPILVGNWQGYNDAGYTPPDNSVAVSNDGIVVSAMNCHYRVFDRTGKQLTNGYSNFYDAFKSKFPSIPKEKYFDPRVLYDSDKDRFIMVILNGSTHETSMIMIMFSKTNNPVDGWYLYAIPGDVLDNELWTDYPAIAVSDKELFITGNLFDDWQAYDQSFVIQMKKDEGFQGQSLQYQVWSDLVNSQGESAFSPLPIGYGMQGNYGSGMYIVSNDRIASDNITLFHIQNQMGAPDNKMVAYTIGSPFTITYPTYSGQKSSQDALNSGDARAKSGFYLNGLIHYVLTTRNSLGTSSVAYFRINTSTKKAEYRLLSETNHHYTYPSIISLATSEDDKSALIGFLRGGTNIYPGIRVVHCNDNFEFSSSVSIRDGVTAVNELTQDKVERWGDYTGFARKYNSVTGVFAGSYGNGGRWKTHIAEVGLASQVAGIEREMPDNNADLTVFPNPVREIFATTFTLNEFQTIEITIYDLMGRKVQTLYQGKERPGGKQFSFNQAALPQGTYLLRITGQGGEIANEKIIVR